MKKNRIFTIINSLFLGFCLLGCLMTAWLFLSKQSFSVNLSTKHVDLIAKSRKSLTKNTKSDSLSQESKLSSTHSTWVKKDNPVKIPILMYHAIHDMTPEEIANANLIVSPKLFEEQIKSLSDAGYYFLSPDETYRALSKNEVPSEKVVWLTFDDSMIDFYQQAYPIMKKYGAVGTNNVITGLTQTNNPANLTLEQMKEMKANGMSFQDHTVNHPDLSVSSLVDQEFEMSDSKTFLDQSLNQKTIAIAYPSGRFSQETLDIAASLQYKLGVTTNEGIAEKSNGLLSLNRVRILPNTSPELLLQTIAN